MNAGSGIGVWWVMGVNVCVFGGRLQIKNCRCGLIKFYLIIISKISLMSFDPKNFASAYVTVE